ncbi:hypothetical protein LTR56_004624 [Elasticomyces elasticus]|nr:hypothetical protein LTR56_004624 [Elasticomyces elasticus]KAK4925964.1 hypothetical protein LTR49_007102 [Elasticomyces elasticus]KAK5768200.1 hypothetical protein LTS12_001684 [Elasticomyces elasticus]
MAESAVTISVNGRHGIDVAKSRPGNEETVVAPVRPGQCRNRDGQDGIDATPSINGGPGGLVAIELSESAENEGYLHAAVFRWDSWQQPVPAVEIPPAKDILLSSAGGDGEDGRIGLDGENGLAGIEGTPATTETDATDGTDGGNGGRSFAEQGVAQMALMEDEAVKFKYC